VAVDTVEADSPARRGCGHPPTCTRSGAGASRSSTALRARPRGASGGRVSRRLRSVGLGPERALIEIASAFTADAGRIATACLLAAPCPTRFSTPTIYWPFGGLGALRDAGRFVPDEVAVVGMDDTELARLCFPTLSSVDLGSAERARIAAKLLLARLKSPAIRRSGSVSRRASSRALRHRSPERMSAAVGSPPRRAGAARACPTRRRCCSSSGAAPDRRAERASAGHAGSNLGFTDSQAGLGLTTHFVGLENFRKLLHDRLFLESFKIGLIWAFAVTAIQFVLALGLALLLSSKLRACRSRSLARAQCPGRCRR